MHTEVQNWSRSRDARGLHGVELIISDAHAGLANARTTVFPNIPWQRCQFHMQQNAQAYVPRKSMKEEVAQDILSEPLERLEAAVLAFRRATKLLKDTFEEFLSFLGDTIPEGPSKGARIDRNDFYQARKQYYERMGWDENGKVLEETLKRFKIS